MDRRFTKIRHADEKVELEFDERHGQRSITSEFSSSDAPAPDFIDALRAFREEVIHICGFQKHWGANIEVRQVNISYKKDRRGVTILATKVVETANSPLLIHTPYQAEPGEGSGEGAMRSTMIEKLNALEICAELYYAGQVAQFEIFPNGKPAVMQGDLVKESESVQMEILRALNEIISPKKAKAIEGQLMADGAIATMLLDEFSDVEWVDNNAGGKDHKWPGIHRHITRNNDVIWCAVRATAGVPRFWYDVDAERFDEAGLAPTRVGKTLFDNIRELYDLANPDAPVRPTLVVEADEPEAVGASAD